ncbi:Putative uncharacterized protein [Taphrina deformans PYCC 5710]|uniref:Cystathionine gamma-synthase n=1 Tax=Taphrina deformans (strain PYCC 5710 / ATCC 11124 / CBS 356.35 / IMI 108563 / JCM 9778 / NBRC 8474) TaxID=1097556 RepID=R4XHJ8_TAPDE|nr:Putative uncharacterized protein [Taphrina deformans PYCC 5710]|eukprot:CCG82892.1 Putative uncharacterized protein [Taphrina deformans PYCC 5710]
MDLSSFSTDLLHADDNVEDLCDVSPAIHLSTTYEYTKDNKPRDAVYSRESVPTVQRCEAVLAKILGAPCVTYSSGLSAAYALLVHLCPRRLYLERAEKGGYHGSLGVADIFKRHSHIEIHTLDKLDGNDFVLEKGDIVWLETPLNPTGEATDIARYAKIAAQKDAVVIVDATFAPPPLQDPLQMGAHWVLHSATKYFGGHSDLLAGVVASNDSSAIAQLLHDRTYLGTIPSGHTAWLLLRSLRTFELRITRQAATAAELVKRLHELVLKSGLQAVKHSSLQHESYIAKQMPGGHSPTFAIYFDTEGQAAAFPRELKLFHHATSLGGVESLVEWRALSDSHCDRRLVRVSVGLENVDDLWLDLLHGIETVRKDT